MSTALALSIMLLLRRLHEPPWSSLETFSCMANDATAVRRAYCWCLLRRPNFVLPIGKGAGKSLTMLLQCQLPYVLFTGLEDFKQCAHLMAECFH